MALHKNLTPLGILSHKNTTAIFARTDKLVGSRFAIVWSEDELHFRGPIYEATIILQSKKKENPKFCSNFHFMRTIDGWIATYTRTYRGKRTSVFASSLDLYTWHVKGEFDATSPDATLVHTLNHTSPYVLYEGGLFITSASSSDLHAWTKSSRLLATSRQGYFDRHPLSIIGSVETKYGPLVLYDASYASGDMQMLQVGGIIFSKDDKEKILWRSHTSLWSGLVHEKYGRSLYPLGITSDDTKAVIYWASEQGAIISTTLAISVLVPEIILPKEELYLKRHAKNPIIAPDPSNIWESEAVFNPAAVYNKGRIHLFYRAIGGNGISVLGYASSKNGLHFDERLDYPVNEPPAGYGDADLRTTPQEYNPLMYTSGGGWSGYEDPRAVRIGNRIYVIYLAFGGWNSMRLALTSISQKDLELGNWKWTDPQFISPPGEIHKNWVLFPEKIKGKFAIMHSITPNILVHYVDSLKDFDNETFIQSIAPKGGRKEYWDTKVRGVGPPPLKTKYGWLVLYHANDSSEPHKYKLGAMILDKNDPTKILYRTSQPILTPDMPYENDGKPGIVYASGAVIRNGKLFIYYGGADKVVCVATAPIEEFLSNVMKDKAVHFESKNSITI